MPNRKGATSKDKNAAGEKKTKVVRGRPRRILKSAINETEFEINLDSPCTSLPKENGMKFTRSSKNKQIYNLHLFVYYFRIKQFATAWKNKNCAHTKTAATKLTD